MERGRARSRRGRSRATIRGTPGRSSGSSPRRRPRTTSRRSRSCGAAGRCGTSSTPTIPTGSTNERARRRLCRGRRRRWELPARGPVGMACLIIAEAAIFTIFVVAYLFYLGKSATGPQPRDVLELPIFIVDLPASRRARRSRSRSTRCAAGSARRVPGLVGWRRSCSRSLFSPARASSGSTSSCDKGLTIRTNLFGTTYYSLVGLHAFHVIVGHAVLPRRARPRARGQGRARARGAHARPGPLLALRRRRLGRGVHGRLRHRALGKSMRTLEEIERERPKSVDLPAPTAWPMVLAFGVTLLFAGLVTNFAVSAVGARPRSWRRPWAGSGRSCRTRSTRPFRSRRCSEFPVSLREQRRPDRARRRGSTARGCPSRSHPISAGVKGGLAGSRGDGGARGSVRRRPAGQRLVPDQPARRRRLGAARGAAAGRPAPVPRGRPPARQRHPPAHLPDGGPALRRHAADVPAPADPARRRDRARCCGRGFSTRPSRWSTRRWRRTSTGRGSSSPQIGFGVVAGVVVTRTAMVRTSQFDSFAVRAGIETPGLMDPKDPGEPPMKGARDGGPRRRLRSAPGATACRARPKPGAAEVRPDEVEELRRPLRRELRRLSRPRRPGRRRRDRPREPRLPRDRRRRGDPPRDGRGCLRIADAGLCARAPAACSPTPRSRCWSAGSAAWEQAGRARRRDAAAVRGRRPARPPRGAAVFATFCAALPRRRRRGRPEGGLDRGRLVPRAGERPVPAHHGHRRPPGHRAARLEKRRPGPRARRAGRLRRGGLARGAATGRRPASRTRGRNP